ncbi:hypothetical protein [Thiohalorhabdus sp.]|uniref:hypothetical protein n=1 Tax=Thiohalorhabdus sp. TaxID=3094134 RepID=UPI002FC2B5F7
MREKEAGSSTRPDHRDAISFDPTWGERAKTLFVPIASVRDFWLLYAALWLGLGVWGWTYVSASVAELGWNSGALSYVNTPFHEFGHILFSPLGEWVESLGGTLGQLLMPMVAGVALLWQRGDTFGASVCLWWLGQNFIDIAPYIADARAGQLPLLGGNTGKTSPYGFHDWEFILGETGLLAYDGALAALSMNIGRFLMVLALVWGAVLLWNAYGKKA